MAPTQELEYECIGSPVHSSPQHDFHANVIPQDTGQINVNLFNPAEILERLQLTLPNLRQILRGATGSDNLESVVEVKLKVIARQVGLQHLGVYLPRLRELTLDGSAVSSLRDLGCALRNLKVLRMDRCGLLSLDGVTGIENLEELHVTRNKLVDISPCAFLDAIKHIDAKRNKLTSVEMISYLSLCDSLEHLELDDNPNLSDRLDYRECIKKVLPKLKRLDGAEFPEGESEKIAGNKAKSPSKEFLDLPPIPGKSRRGSSASSGSGNCSYSVSFSPRVLSPRSEASGTTSTSSLEKDDIKVKKTEFPKL